MKTPRLRPLGLLSLAGALALTGCAESVLGNGNNVSGGDTPGGTDGGGATEGGGAGEGNGSAADSGNDSGNATTGAASMGNVSDTFGGGDEGGGEPGEWVSPCGHGGAERVITADDVREPVAREACGDRDYSDVFTPGYQVSEEVRNEVASLIASMDTTQKATQMRGTDPAGPNFTDIFRSADDDALGIRGFGFRDGPRGVSLEAGCSGNCWATTFPTSISRGASFDMCLEAEVGLAHGDETLASGNTMMLAPMVNLLRHTGWGRSQEGYSEDPFVSGRLGAAYTVGVQRFIPACVKHYMANNIENGRDSLSADMDEQTLMEIYGRAFQMNVEEAGVACVMAAYNRVNGVKNTENAFTLGEVLRGRFGFQGMVLSDWWAMTGGQNLEIQVTTQQQTAAAGLNAGLDMELPWNYFYSHIEALANGEVPLQNINDSASRILETKLRFNVARGDTLGLQRPTTGWDPGTQSITNNQHHIDLAYRTAIEGTVLLKNDNNTLPVDIDAVNQIAVLSATVPFSLTIGESGTINYARDVLTGDEGSSRMREDPALAISPLEGFEARGGSKIVFGEDVSAAADADFIVVMAGLNAGDEGEEYTGAGDRSSFALDAKISNTPQNDLIQAAAALGKPMVVVLIGGGVIDMPWLDQVPAVMMAWYPGMRGGDAIADLVLGNANPSGKLPISWAPWSDMPPFTLSSGAIDLEYFVGYRFFENAGRSPMFPFGHGLSYSTFEYANLEVPCSTVSKNGVVDVMVDVANTGSVAGDETVFLFASYPGASDPRKQVKKVQGFYRVHLEPGEAKQIRIPLRVNELRFWQEGSGWVTDAGEVLIEVASNATGSNALTETIVVE